MATGPSTMRSLRDAAEQSLEILKGVGFDHVQSTASWTAQQELCITRGVPSLMRSKEGRKLSLLGIVDGRRVAAELDDLHMDSLLELAGNLLKDALESPGDAAHAVSVGELARIDQGPQEADQRVLAAKAAELLGFRRREAPSALVCEGVVGHSIARSHTFTSSGSELAVSIGWYSMSVLACAREAERSSALNLASGSSHDLRVAPAAGFFGIGDMLRDTCLQIGARPFAGELEGQVVLGPRAVADLVAWLLSQLGDLQLIHGNSLYRERVGLPIASSLVGLRSRFDAPGIAAVSPDACVARPIELIRGGCLLALIPSLYGSRKTGLRHVPTSASGWELAAGDTALSDLVAGVATGALVGRLSMGLPAGNGDFSAVIKNSFEIVDGRLGAALSDTMISANVAHMLHDISGISRERIDSGELLAPWLRIDGIQFF